MAKRRFALFTHDSYGLGHVRRSSRILHALAHRDPDAALLLITGSPATHLLRNLPRNADTLKIPTIVTSGTSETRPSGLNIGVAELASLRSELTLRALTVFEPDVLLVDNFPLGTRLELLPVIRALRHRPMRLALGIRDILDPPDKVKRDWARDGVFEVVERYYDRVLVYGVPDVLDVTHAYGFSRDLARRAAYCGYVTEAAAPPDPEAARRELGLAGGFLLATVGGGGDGRPLLEAFLGALVRFPGRPALVVTGEFMSPSDRQAVRCAAAACDGVIVRDFVENLPSLMAAADLVVAMGGYNTSAEILATGARAVLVPRTWRAGEHGSRGATGVDGEQLVRAEALARLGVVTTVPPHALCADRLGAAMADALATSRPALAGGLRLDGASQVADHLIALAAR